MPAEAELSTSFAACPAVPEAEVSEQTTSRLAAIPTEKVHSILRRMSDADWASLKELMARCFTQVTHEADVAVLERLFRQSEPIGREAGGIVLRMVQAMAAEPSVMEHLRNAQERLRTRIRFVLREMSDAEWDEFKVSLEERLPAGIEESNVLELVFRIGESVSNVEVAALALDQARQKRLDPEVARKNAEIRAHVPGLEKSDPAIAYLAAKQAMERAQETALRAANTLAYSYVEPTAPYKHARNTVFKAVDAIIEDERLMAEATRLEQGMARAKPVSREQMRWALHRLPIRDRMRLLKLIPLNTILMFQEHEGGGPAQELHFKATRDRRLAYDLFVLGRTDEDLMHSYGLCFNAVKNTVGSVLQTLIERPQARLIVNDYLAKTGQVEPMAPDEVRRRMKQLTGRQKAELLNGIPSCAWKVRSVIPVHKHLFLDYMSGEWVLGALVDYYNLEKSRRLTGTFRQEGTLTVRGANAALASVVQKIAEEPELRQQLRRWTAPHMQDSAPAETEEAIAPRFESIMPPAPRLKPAEADLVFGPAAPGH